MNTRQPITLSALCLLTLLLPSGAHAADSPAPTPPAAVAAPPAAVPSAPAEPRPPTATTPAPAVTTPAPAVITDEAKPTAAALPNGSKELRLNFRNAPLESVLNYMSDAAGFIIFPKVDLKGKVTVWSNQPVSREEALDLLNSALDQNGYAAVRNGRTLTIWNKEDAKKQDLPVKSGNRPEDIPKNDEMVTQIIPVRFIGAVQVSRDLQPLLPDKATMTANEGGNAIILTDTQTSIRRMTEIIKALDTAVSSVSAVKVFKLQYADAKAVATVIKDLFAPQDTARTGNNQQQGGGRQFNMVRGGGAAGGFGGGAPGGGGGGGQGNAGGGSAAGGGRAPTPKVTAVSEDRSNSVVVSAPDDQMPIIEDLIKQVDTNVEDITELRVFRLKYADAQETADLLSNLFADNNTSSSNNQGNRGGQIQFGGRFGGFGGANFGGAGGNRGATGGADVSSRSAKQQRVLAVADLRTGSVVVSAARDLMVQIGKMVAELDSDASKKQQVFVFDVQNTDPQGVQDILQSLFPAPNNGTSVNSRQNSRNQNGAGSQLNNRATQNQNQGNRGGGNTGFGGSGGGGGGGNRGFGQ